MRIAVFAAVASLAIVGISEADDARGSIRKLINIPAQGLESALQEFAKQRDLQVVYRTAVIGDMRSRGASGDLTPEEALQKVLSGTGLTFRYLDEKTVTIVPTGTGLQSVSSAEERVQGEDSRDDLNTQGAQKNPFWERFRLAQLSQGAPAESSSVAKGDNDPSLENEKDRKLQLDEVIVTGSHIRNESASASPKITITREDIEKGGFNSLADVLQALPENLADVNATGGNGTALGSRGTAINLEGASAVNLRGLGAGSTLTLLNGVRWAGAVGGRFFDVSTIPLSMIDRVDVVTGGHSAVYGSEAVGGVVNLVTRRAYDGAASELSYGGDHPGSDQLQFSQVYGQKYDDGGFVLGYDYLHQSPLNLLKTKFVTSPIQQDGSTPLYYDLIPEESRHSIALSGHHAASDIVDIHGDLLYTQGVRRRATVSLMPGAADGSFAYSDTPSEQYGGAIGARVALPRAWSLELSGSSSVHHMEARSHQTLSFAYGSLPPFSSTTEQRDRLTTMAAIADGPLPQLGGITPQMAVGIEWQREQFTSTTLVNGLPFTDLDSNRRRRVHSAFAELNLPMINEGPVGLRKVSISIAGRYDDYSDFGSTFNPQFGIVWAPLLGLDVRGSYSRSFRAPAADDLISLKEVLITEQPDPDRGGANTPVLVLQGGNPKGLGPEHARIWTGGFAVHPGAAPGLTASVDYFHINYEDRITTPEQNPNTLFSRVLENAAAYGSAILVRNATPAQVAEAVAGVEPQNLIDLTTTPFDPASQNVLSVFPGAAIFHGGIANIASETVHGLDVSGSLRAALPIGALSLDINGSYTFNHTFNVTPAAPPVYAFDQVGQSSRFRMRSGAGLARGAYGAYLYVNYIKSYQNPFSTPPSTMPSWTTVDLVMTLDAAKLWRSDLWSNTKLTFTIRNMLDRDPPEFVNPGTVNAVRLDTANANVEGRVMTLRLAKKW